MKHSEYPLTAQLNTVHDWIKSADQKIGISFAVINGVALAFIIPSSKIIIENTEYLTNFIFFISLIEVLVFLAIGELCAVLALFPRLKSKVPAKSLLYFGSLATMTPPELRKIIKNTSIKELEDDYVNQLIVSSQISSTKHAQLKNAIQAFIVALIFMFIFLLCLILIRSS